MSCNRLAIGVSQAPEAAIPRTRIHQSHGPRAAVDDALLSLQLVESLLCQSVFRAPWGVHVPDSPGAMTFLAVVEGSCRVHVAETDLPLHIGDFVLLPQGSAYRLTDPGGSPAVPPMPSSTTHSVASASSTPATTDPSPTSSRAC